MWWCPNPWLTNLAVDPCPVNAELFLTCNVSVVAGGMCCLDVSKAPVPKAEDGGDSFLTFIWPVSYEVMFARTLVYLRILMPAIGDVVMTGTMVAGKEAIYRFTHAGCVSSEPFTPCSWPCMCR